MGRRVAITCVSMLVSALLGVLGGVVLLSSGGTTDPEEPIAPDEDVVVAVRPSESVERFLESLAAEDASAALAEAAVLPADRTLLTDDALRASHELAPMTDISVPETSGAGSSVEASYRLGDELVTTSFSVTEVPGGFKLDEVASTLDMTNLRSADLPLVVAGLAVSSDSVTVFPGLYPVQTESPYIGYGSEQVLVKYPGDSPSTSALDAVITEEGSTIFRDLVQEQLTECLAATVPEPEGCPFSANVPSSQEIEADSGSWSGSAEEMLEEFEPALAYDDPTAASWFLNTELSYAYSYTSDLEEGTQDETAQAFVGATYQIDLTADTLEVSFS